MTLSKNDLSRLTRPATSPHAPYPELQEALSCDVCIIGGGLTGLMTALLCKRANQEVVILERDRVGSGESHLSSGQVTEILDTPFRQLSKIHSKETLQLFTEHHRAAIHQLHQWIEEWRGEGGAGMVRVPGYLFTEHDHQVSQLREELGFLADFHISSNSQKHSPLPFPIVEAIRVENQALLDPVALIAVLREAAQSEGVRIFEGSPVQEIAPPQSPHNKKVRVRTPGGSISSSWCVLATHSPTLDLHPVHFEMKAYRSYALCAELRNSTLLLGNYWDMPLNRPSSSGSVYHSINPTETGVLIGGMDHPVGRAPRPEFELLMRLEDYSRSRFEIERFTQAWSGQTLESADGLPYVGHSLKSDQILFATGYGGNGISLAALAANLLQGRITGAPSELFSALSPFRIKNRRTWVSLASNGFNYLEKKTMSGLSRASLPDPRSIAPGEACIGEHEKAWVAMSRDEDGALHAVSAKCSHLGAELTYNELEKTWECPCHGSRFTRDGKVICGPALHDLEKVVIEPAQEKPEAA